MATANDCYLPDDLWYFMDKHVWLRPEPDGTVTVGIDAVAMKLAGNVIVVTPKRVGRAIARGQSVATMESSKWVGPVPTPIGGELVATNAAVTSQPKVLNEDPYANWIARLRPSDWETDKADLVQGPDGIERYRAYLVEQGISCA
jgi:glycine cleavage system H protein